MRLSRFSGFGVLFLNLLCLLVRGLIRMSLWRRRRLSDGSSQESANKQCAKKSFHKSILIRYYNISRVSARYLKSGSCQAETQPDATATFTIVPEKSKISPSLTVCANALPVQSMNCGKHARKRSAAFGLGISVITP